MTVTKKPVHKYVHQEFPKWKYHAFNASKIIHTVQDEIAMGDEWKNSPALISAAPIPASKEPPDEVKKRGRPAKVKDVTE